MPRKRVPDQPEPDETADRPAVTIVADAGTLVYRDKSGPPMAAVQTEGSANFGEITRSAHETLRLAQEAEATGGDASHGPKSQD